MKAPILIFICFSLLSINSFALDKNDIAQIHCQEAELITVDGNFSEIERMFSSSSFRQEQNRICREHEEEFRDHVLAILGGLKAFWNHMESCLGENQQTSENPRCRGQKSSDELFMNALKVYRPAQARVNQRLANEWIKNLEEPELSLAKLCFIPREQHNYSPYHFKFEERVGQLKRQNNQLAIHCNFMTSSWNEFREENMNLAKNGNHAQFGISDEDIQAINDFDQSFFGNSVGNPLKFNLYDTEEDLRADLHEKIEDISNGMNRLYRQIENLGRNRLYELYDYEDLYENHFLSFLSDREKNLFFPTCRDNSSWLGSCVGPGTGDHARCATRTIDFVWESIPGISAFDGMMANKSVKMAELSSLLTSDEADNAEFGNALQIVFGLPAGGAFAAVPLRAGATGMALETGEEVSESLLTRFVRDESGTVLKLRNRTFEVSTCLPNCNVDRIILSQADSDHIVEHIVDSDDAINVINQNIDRLREIANDPNLNSGNRRSAIGNALRDFDNSPIRRDRTTLFPEGVTPEDVLGSLKDGPLRLVDGNDVRDIFEINYGNDRYRMYLCTRGPCSRVIPGTNPIQEEVIPEGRVLSIHPVCGDNVRRLMASSTIAASLHSALRGNRDLEVENFVVESNPCTD